MSLSTKEPLVRTQPWEQEFLSQDEGARDTPHLPLGPRLAGRESGEPESSFWLRVEVFIQAVSLRHLFDFLSPQQVPAGPQWKGGQRLGNFHASLGMVLWGTPTVMTL